MRLEDAIRKMCEVAGHDYDKIDFKDAVNPYYKLQWTIAQEQEYKEWLIDAIKKDKVLAKDFFGLSRPSKERILKGVSFFIFNHGFSTVDEYEARRAKENI